MTIKQRSRPGYTKITSISITKEMQARIDEHNLSPTEIFRRGLGVTYHDLGLQPYASSPLNKERSEYVKKFLDSLEEAEDLEIFEDSIKKINNFSAKMDLVIEAVNKINIIFKKIGVIE